MPPIATGNQNVSQRVDQNRCVGPFKENPHLYIYLNEDDNGENMRSHCMGRDDNGIGLCSVGHRRRNLFQSGGARFEVKVYQM